jgi:hypothetical protein
VTTTLTPAGTWLVSAGKVWRTVTAGRHDGVDGWWAQDFTGTDTGLPTFLPSTAVAPAEVGRTVCRHPDGGGDLCPLVHVRPALLAFLLPVCIDPAAHALLNACRDDRRQGDPAADGRCLYCGKPLPDQDQP